MNMRNAFQLFSSFAFNFFSPPTLPPRQGGTPRIPHLSQWQQQSPSFASWKLANYSGLLILPSSHFQSIHKFPWFYCHHQSCIFRLLSTSVPGTLTATSRLDNQNYPLMVQELPGCHSCLPPIYDIAAAKTMLSKPKSDYVSFLFRKSPGFFLPPGLYALLFYWNNFYTLHMDSSFSSPRFQNKCHLPNGTSLAILSEVGPPLCYYLTHACLFHSVCHCNYLFVCS